MSIGTIIFVVTSHLYLGYSGKQTGWYLPEVAHPHHVLTTAGYEIVFVSPKGGEAPMDKLSGEAFKNDDICQTFLKDKKHIIMKDGVPMLKNTLHAAQIKASEYKALFYAGGHGAMFDFPQATDIAELAADIYKQGGVLSAVGHGPAGFVPVTVDSESIVKRQTVTSFTNTQEDAINVSKYMPFMLETRLRILGANFVWGRNWVSNVQVCGKLITGQNTNSAQRVGEEMVKLLLK